jgi:predicted aminopeptidase
MMYCAHEMIDQSNIRIKNRLWLVAGAVCLAILPALQLAGCAGPAYYAQAVSGHLGLMNKRTSVTELLANSGTDPELASSLSIASQAREFAITYLALPDDGSYTEFVQTGKDAVVWNVVAAPEFSLAAKQWCFIVSGCVSYRGYFKQQSAEKFAARLKTKGFDVTVSPAIAYSTLGWFDDPLLDTMFRYSDVQLAAFVFHELAHAKLYVKSDTAFNEAYANAVESIGVSLWLKDQGRNSEFADWQAMQSAAREFNELLQNTQKTLNMLYTQPSGDQTVSNPEIHEDTMRAGKEQVLSELLENYRDKVEQDWGGKDYYQGWFARPINNASLALMNSYQGGECAFSELWQQSGDEMANFHTLAQEQAELPEDDRQEWLSRSCESVASNAEL